MKLHRELKIMLPFYILVPVMLLVIANCTSRSVTTMANSRIIRSRATVIIDAGHGGIDGGASTLSGVRESQINLQIAIRLDDLMHFLGIQTKMIRTDDVSVYKSGDTIAAKKISDLKERVRIANETDKALLISIHQNHFDDQRYYGPQVFYNHLPEAKELSETMQKTLTFVMSPDSRRACKKANGIYLMEKVNCPAVLVECGFLSNNNESLRLQNSDYQKRLCAILATCTSSFLSNT